MNDNVMTADAADVEKNKVMAILAYIIFFIPLLAAKDSPFAMYHANQGTWLAIIGFVGTFILSIILGVTIILACLIPLLPIPVIIYAVLGMVNASQGKMVPLPGFASLPTLFK